MKIMRTPEGTKTEKVRMRDLFYMELNANMFTELLELLEQRKLVSKALGQLTNENTIKSAEENIELIENKIKRVLRLEVFNFNK